jgi:hypothetical protein
VGAVTRERWARELLARLPAPDGFDQVVAIVAWEAAEGTTAAWNPLATTMPAPGSTRFNAAGVQNYPSFDVGLDATVRTLRLRHYTAIVDALRRGAPARQVLEAVAASPWGTGEAAVRALEPTLRGWPRTGQVLVYGPGEPDLPRERPAVTSVTNPNWVEDVLGRARGWIGRIVGAVFGFLKDILEGIVRTILEAVEALVRFVSGLVNAAIDGLRDVVAAIWRRLAEVPGWIATATADLWRRMVDFVRVAIDEAIRAFTRFVVDPIQRLVSDLVDKVSHLWRFLLDYGSRITRFFDDFFGRVVEFFVRVADWLRDFAIGVGRAIVDFFTAVGRWLRDFAEKVGRTIVAFFEEVGGWLWSWARRFWQGLEAFARKWLGPLLDMLERFGEAFFRFLRDPVGFFRRQLDDVVARGSRWWADKITGFFRENADRLESFLTDFFGR